MATPVPSCAGFRSASVFSRPCSCVGERGRVGPERLGPVRGERGEVLRQLVGELDHRREVVPEVLVERALRRLLVVAGDVGHVRRRAASDCRRREHRGDEVVVARAVLDDDLRLAQRELRPGVGRVLVRVLVGAVDDRGDRDRVAADGLDDVAVDVRRGDDRDGPAGRDARSPARPCPSRPRGRARGRRRAGRAVEACRSTLLKVKTVVKSDAQERPRRLGRRQIAGTLPELVEAASKRSAF